MVRDDSKYGSDSFWRLVVVVVLIKEVNKKEKTCSRTSVHPQGEGYESERVRETLERENDDLSSL